MSQAARPRVPEFHRTEIDGIPTFWADIEGPDTAALVFRVGRTDEAPIQGGISHLIEHLVIGSIGIQAYDYGGEVDGLFTTFHASGSPGQVSGFLEGVAATLSALPLDRIPLERRVLHREGMTKESGLISFMIWLRYGYAGLGLMDTPEVAQDWIGPDPVGTWARARFTRGNAALWFTKPPPRRLRLRLPDGPRSRTTSAPDISDLAFPAFHPAWAEAVGVTMTTDRSSAASAAMEIVADRAMADLRFARGLAYDVSVHREVLDRGAAHVGVIADCDSPTNSKEVGDTLLAIVDAIASDGPTPTEIARYRERRSSELRHPGFIVGELNAAAEDHLLGGTRPTLAAQVREAGRLDAGEIAATLRTAVDRSLLVAAEEPPSWPALHRYPTHSPDAVSGRRFRPKRSGEPDQRDRLVVGPDGVTLLDADRRARTVRFAECLAVRHTSEHIRQLWGPDGFSVEVDATDWKRGKDAVDLIDRAVSPDLVACERHGIGGLSLGT